MKKVLSIIKTVLVWLVVAVAVFMMIFTIFSVNMFDRNDRSIFGIRMYTVLTDSMAATDFSAGAIVFMKEVDPSTLKEGDIISYISQSTESFGEVITHKIRSKTTDAQGNPGFITYGTTTGVDDEMVITYPYITGKYIGHIPGIGHFFNFLKTPQGYLVCIFIPFALLIIYQGIRVINLFRRYRKEQMAEVEEEKARLAREREENERMLAELQALRLQMMGGGGVPPADAPVAPEAPAAPIESENCTQADAPKEQPAETDASEGATDSSNNENA